MKHIGIAAIVIVVSVVLVEVGIASGSFGLASRTNPYSTPECGKDVGRTIGTANGTSHFGGYQCSTKPCVWNMTYPIGRCFA